MTKPAPISVGIVGGTGYTGVELLRLLAAHPQVQLRCVTSRSEAGKPLAELFPSLRGVTDLRFSADADDELRQCDAVFFATPHGVAMQQAPALLERGIKVLDLAADFRLMSTQTFEHWYKMPHTQPELLREAVYGLPELHREAIRQARLVAVPGCYPTSVQLGFAPLLSGKSGLVESSTLIADCKSGVSGAGRKAEIELGFAETADNFKSYGVSGHRHSPEIEQGLRALSGDLSLRCQFVPHLLPTVRGIHATLYARLTTEGQATALQHLYEQHFAGETFVDVMPAGSCPQTRSVRGSNYVRMAIHRPQPDLAVCLVVLDNLVKGAAGQAVQCFNLLFGLPEDMGLRHIALSP